MKDESTLPCIRIKPGGACLEGLLPAVYEATLVHSNTHGRHALHTVADQTTSAIIYVAIVVIFYVLIIAILVGTTLRRRSLLAEDMEESTHLLLYDQKTDTVRPTAAVPASRLLESGLVTV
ncbi:uncharacterized protein LOC108669278 [Hyalella azteca]|uniref:Uncharacterized protein LOC108669278 n=1 Tax=Hyalella azteca TaxID=294128 RepID=A0A8B7NF47_HYAAZ|nr:uncharacterized protein LOC108669278 [Hyalella azteca]